WPEDDPPGPGAAMLAPGPGPRSEPTPGLGINPSAEPDGQLEAVADRDAATGEPRQRPQPTDERGQLLGVGRRVVRHEDASRRQTGTDRVEVGVALLLGRVDEDEIEWGRRPERGEELPGIAWMQGDDSVQTGVAEVLHRRGHLPRILVDGVDMAP